MRAAALNFRATQAGSAQPKVLVVSPHPDDEIIGAGTRLPILANVVIAQVTDGSPPDLADARANGFSTREAYARARRSELLEAIALAGHARVVHLGFSDQEASLRLASLAIQLQDLIDQFTPDLILTVPYEGGHPDHDATAFAVHTAVSLVPSRLRPAVIEMSAYHNGPNGNGCAYNAFLNSTGDEITIQLSPEECALKRRMFDCFRTQAHVLQWFPIALETFRFAPRYDFTAAPHPGPLYYENFQWGLTGERWRELAREALQETLQEIHPRLK